MNTPEATILVESLPNLLRMIILTISPSSLNMYHVWSKTRSVGEIIEKPCEHETGHIMHPIIMKLCQNVCLDDTADKFEYGSCRVKN